MHSRCESDTDSIESTPSSLDEDDTDFNERVTPYWPKYRSLIRSRGFSLDTCRDVKEFYHRYWETLKRHQSIMDVHISGYSRACKGQDDALCKDAGLPDNLFRGSCVADNTKVVIKATHVRSQEFVITQFLSGPQLRRDPMNHSIPILDLIECPDDNIGFIVMEDWSSQLVTSVPCCLRSFLAALQQCIQHIAFLHKNRIAHLDISPRNILTDLKGHYAYIDYERSRRYDATCPPVIHKDFRSTEVPPEIGKNDCCNPYKVDIWALGILILRTCKLTGFDIPELMHLIKPMLDENPDRRPSALQVLKAFNSMVTMIRDARLEICAAPRGS